MTVDMRVYDGIVEQALDMSKTYREDERTEEELRALFKHLGIEVPEDKLKAVGRYVEMAKSRRADSDFNTFGPGASSGV